MLICHILTPLNMPVIVYLIIIHYYLSKFLLFIVRLASLFLRLMVSGVVG